MNSEKDILILGKFVTIGDICKKVYDHMYFDHFNYIFLKQGDPRLCGCVSRVCMFDRLRSRRPPLASTVTRSMPGTMVGQPALHQQLLHQHRTHGELTLSCKLFLDKPFKGNNFGNC